MPGNTYGYDFDRSTIPATLADQARSRPDHVLLRHGNVTYTYADAHATAVRIAHRLVAAGVGRGDRVCVFLNNCVEFALTWFGTAHTGGIFAPVNTNLRGASLDYELDDLAPTVVVTSVDLYERLTAWPGLSKVTDVFVVGGGADTTSFDVLLTPVDDRGPLPETRANDPVQIVYTSGTTGAPKGMVLPSAHDFAEAWVFIKATGLTADDVVYSPLPLFHGVASRLGLLPCLIRGATFVMGSRFSASNYWREAAEAGATVGQLVTALPSLLLKQPPSRADRGHTVRVVYNAKYDPEFVERFGVGMAEAYGLSESGLFIWTGPENRRVGSSGTVDENWEVRLVDDLDRPVPDGTVGEATIRPKVPHIMMQGYFNKPDATLTAFRNLWFHTGDYLRRDADGWYYFVDRKNDALRRRGENISSWEVERALYAHPAVGEAAVLGWPGDDGQDEVWAIVVTKEGREVAPRALAEHCAEQLPYYAVPRYIEFQDQLPRTATNKVTKHQLRAAGLAADVWDAVAEGYRPQR